MVCPNCKLADLTITGDNYFCPSCKIFIGKVATFKDEEKNQVAQSGVLVPEKPQYDTAGTAKNWGFSLIIPVVIILVTLYSIKDLFYLDFQRGCAIFITPSITLEFSNAGVKRAMEIIKNISPDNYSNICKRVNFISTDPSCGGFEGGCFEPNKPRTIFVSAPSRNVTWVAEVLAHEACHVKQADEDRPFDEQECHEIGLKVMQEATLY